MSAKILPFPTLPIIEKCSNCDRPFDPDSDSANGSYCSNSCYDAAIWESEEVKTCSCGLDFYDYCPCEDI